MTSSVIFNITKEKAGLFHCLMRCIDPDCCMKTELKVSHNGNILIQNGIQVFNFMTDLKQDDFLDTMKTFSKQVITSDFIIIEDSVVKRFPRKVLKQEAILYGNDTKEPLPLGKVNYADKEYDSYIPDELTIYTGESRYVKHIPAIVLGAMGYRYPGANELAVKVRSKYIKE